MTTNDSGIMNQLVDSYKAVTEARQKYNNWPCDETQQAWRNAAIEYNNLSLEAAVLLERDFRKSLYNPPAVIKKPPVEIDDTLYFIINGDVYKATVVLLSYTEYRNHIVTELRGEVHPFHTVSVTWDDWNVKVFRTEEEAYANLTKKKDVVLHYDA